jgi:hypothetical protein
MKEPNEYESLIQLNDKLISKSPSAEEFVYVNDNSTFATFRTMRNNKYTFKIDNIYELDLKFYVREANGRTFINAEVIASKLHKKAEPVDRGNAIDMSDFE